MTHRDKLEPLGKWKPQRHTKICLLHLRQSHSNGWPKEKWVSFGVMLPAYLAQNREDKEEVWWEVKELWANNKLSYQISSNMSEQP